MNMGDIVLAFQDYAMVVSEFQSPAKNHEAGKAIVEYLAAKTCRDGKKRTEKELEEPEELWMGARFLIDIMMYNRLVAYRYSTAGRIIRHMTALLRENEVDFVTAISSGNMKRFCGRWCVKFLIRKISKNIMKMIS